MLHCIIRVEQVSHEMRYNSQYEEQSTAHSNQHNVTVSCPEAKVLSQAPMKTSIGKFLKAYIRSLLLPACYDNQCSLLKNGAMQSVLSVQGLFFISDTTPDSRSGLKIKC